MSSCEPSMSRTLPDFYSQLLQIGAQPSQQRKKAASVTPRPLSPLFSALRTKLTNFAFQHVKEKGRHLLQPLRGRSESGIRSAKQLHEDLQRFKDLGVLQPRIRVKKLPQVFSEPESSPDWPSLWRLRDAANLPFPSDGAPTERSRGAG